MMDTLERFLGLGLEPSDLTFVQISVRSVIVFFAALAMVRIGSRRFLTKMTSLDILVGFILASMLSRAVNGSSAFFPSLGAGFVLVVVHRLLASLSFRSHQIGSLLKGEPDCLVRDGRIDEAAVRRNHISTNDLLEELRLNGNLENVEDVKCATLERSGEISVVPYSPVKRPSN